MPLGVCTGGNYWPCFEGLYLGSSFLKISPKHKLRRMTEVCLQPLGIVMSNGQVLSDIHVKPSASWNKDLKTIWGCWLKMSSKPSQIGWAMQSRVQAGWWQRWPHGPFKLHRMLSRAFWPIVGQVWRHREWEGKARKMGVHLTVFWLHLDSESLLWTTQGLQDPAVFDELCTTTFLLLEALVGGLEGAGVLWSY